MTSIVRILAPTSGEIKRDDIDEKYQQARIKFLKEQFAEDFEELVSITDIADALDSRFHQELYEIYQDIANPDDMRP